MWEPGSPVPRHSEPLCPRRGPLAASDPFSSESTCFRDPHRPRFTPPVPWLLLSPFCPLPPALHTHPPLSCRVFSWSLVTPVCGIATVSSAQVSSSRPDVPWDISAWVSHGVPGCTPDMLVVCSFAARCTLSPAPGARCPQLPVLGQKSRVGRGLAVSRVVRRGRPFPFLFLRRWPVQLMAAPSRWRPRSSHLGYHHLPLCGSFRPQPRGHVSQAPPQTHRGWIRGPFCSCGLRQRLLQGITAPNRTCLSLF